MSAAADHFGWHLSDRECDVMLALVKSPGVTTAELAKTSGWPINATRAALSRLRRLGLVYPKGAIPRLDLAGQWRTLTETQHLILGELRRCMITEDAATAGAIAARVGRSRYTISTYLTALRQDGWIYPWGAVLATRAGDLRFTEEE